MDLLSKYDFIRIFFWVWGREEAGLERTTFYRHANTFQLGNITTTTALYSTSFIYTHFALRFFWFFLPFSNNCLIILSRTAFSPSGYFEGFHCRYCRAHLVVVASVQLVTQIANVAAAIKHRLTERTNFIYTHFVLYLFLAFPCRFSELNFLLWP